MDSTSGRQEAFWLQKFVQDREQEASWSASDSHEYKGRTHEGHDEGKQQFCGIVTNPVHGVVDSAAEGGLIGMQALDRLQQALHHRGFRVKWTPKTCTAKGVGGAAEAVGVILIPIGIGGINGILEATVVRGDVPFLLPVSLLKSLNESGVEFQRLHDDTHGDGHRFEIA